MAINFRHIKESALTHAEMDSNLGSYFHSASILVNDDSGSTITLFRSESNGSSLTLTSASIEIVSSSYALTASYADNGGSVDYISSMSLDGSILRITGSNNAFDGTIDLSGISTDTGSLLKTSSATDNIITFTKGDNTTYTVTIDTGSGGSTDYISSMSLDESILRITGSGNAFDGAIEMNNYTASHAVSASYALSASHETTYELSSSYADNAASSSYAATASYAENGGGGSQTLAQVTALGAVTTDRVNLNGGVSVNGSGSGAYLYISGNAATTDPDNTQGIALAWNDSGGSRENMLYWNPGAVSSSANDDYYFAFQNEFLDANNSDTRATGSRVKIFGNGLVNLSGSVPTIENAFWRMPTQAGTEGQILKYPSSGTTLEWDSNTFLVDDKFIDALTGSLLPTGSLDPYLLTGSLSASIVDLGYIDKTASRVDLGFPTGSETIDEYLTGSLIDIITGSGIDLISASGLGDRIIGEGFLLTSSLNDRLTGSFIDIITGSGIDLISASGLDDRIIEKGFLPTGSLEDYLTGSLFEIITGSGIGIFSGSGQLPGGLLSGSGQLPGGLISGSTQLGELNFLNKTESRLDIQDFLTASLSDVITGSSLTLLSGSGQVEDLGFLNGLGTGLISGSGQIDDLGFLSSLSTGLISGSGQIEDLDFLNRTASRLDISDFITGSLADLITGSSLDIFSGSGQVSFTGLTNKPGGLISGSGQLPSGLFSGSFGDLAPSGLLSGSSQVDFTGLTNIPTGLLSGSTQLGDLNFLTKTESRLDIQDFLTASLSDVITGSSLSIVSASGQVDFTSLLNKPGGLISGSGQLPSGLVSGSGQVSFTGLDSIPADLVSGSVIRELPANLISASAQVSFTSISSKPSGLVSGSGQVSFSGLDSIPSGLLSGSTQLGDLNFLTKTESRLDISDFLTGSLSDVITGSSLSIVSGSVIRELPADLVSSSAQVSFASISSKPTGLVSGSSQVSFTGLGSIPADIVSGSVIRELPANLISGSGQVAFGSISGKPSGLISGSGQLPTGLVSGSAQVSFASISSKPSGLVSGSGQVSFGSISGKPADLVSGSVIRELPANLVSASAQVSFASISSKPSGLVSGSGQIAFNSISSIPSGLVSASGQIDYDNLTNLPTLFDGTYASLTSKPSLLSSSLQITFDDIPSVPPIISGSDQIADLGFSGDYTHPNHSGDVTSAGDGATTIGANKVTHAKYQQVATDTIIGRTAAGDGNVTALTAAEVRTILNVANGATANTGDITGVTAGDGLSGGASSGAATVTLGDPSTLTAATTNGTTATSHTHAITTTDSGTADTIVATDADGEITAANFVTTSDKKLKSNIKPIKEGLEVIKKFVSYEYELNGKQDAGFIAQEVQEVLPYAVHEKTDGFLGMNNKPVLAHLHKAILELDQRLTDIENKIK
jgi:hypothetical protein